MPFWISICIAFGIGAVFGMILTACLVASGRDDR